MKIQSDQRIAGQWTGIARSILSVPVGLLLLFTLSSTAAGADAPVVVGDGTPASCTYDALDQAITSGPASGTITFNCGPNPVTIFIAEVEINKDLTIDGGGLITFTGFDFLIDSGTVEFLNFTMANAGGEANGAIGNGGTLTLHNITLRNNGAGHGVGGGGIYNRGTLTIEDSTLASNIGGCNIGSCGPGGAIYNSGDLHIVNSTLSGNVSGGTGGGIFNLGSATIENSTFVGNGSTGGFQPTDGGAIYNSGRLRLVNSTISGNSATGNGGGIYNTSTVMIQNSTIANNTTYPGPIGSGRGAGIYNANTVFMQNTILAGNTDSNNQAPDCSGALTSQGYNLIQRTTGCTISGDTTGNLLNVDPLLGPLQDNGGPTFTLAPLSGSPAVDSANPAAPSSGGNACESTDQRSVVRPQDGNGDGVARCDIGAVELKATVLPVTIDIKPGTINNPINPKSQGKLPVAILSTATFAAKNVVASSVKFGPNGALAASSSLEDVNGDGRLDLVLHFRSQETGLQKNDTQACLSGMTRSDIPIRGCDGIHIVP